MRKILMWAAVLAGFGLAGAQTQVEGENGTYRLNGCSVQDKQVVCEVMYTLTKSEKLRVYFRDTAVFSLEGQKIFPKNVYVGGVSFFSSEIPNAELYKNIPVKLSVATGLPTTTTAVRALILENGNVRFDNIPVPGVNATPSAPVAATPTASNGAYSAVLTGCKAGANGTLTCTATLTPRR